jgi:hypothetical protein
MKKNKEDTYDMLGISAQRAYDQNPEAQFRTKESMGILAQIIQDNPLECKYAYYLKMSLVDGYTLREIGRIEKQSIPIIQKRINQVTLFLKTEVKKLNASERKPV